jgi:cation diffusion facilitator family transporter
MKEPASNRTALIRRAALIAVIGNGVLALLKLGAGLYTGSLAVLGDGIDSTADVATSLMTLAVGFIISRPSDKEHPWGHHRAETLATVVLAFVIMLAGFQLALAAVQRLIGAEERAVPGVLALWVTAFSMFGKLLLAYSQFRLGRKADSAMILANARNMRNDIVISASVLVGIGASSLFGQPALDSITALLVGVWVMKTGVGIFMEQNQELMDGHVDDSLYRALFDAVKSVSGAGNPHRARIRKMASTWDIDLDIEVDGTLTVAEAHDIAEQVEAAIRRNISDVYDIVVHVEPAGLDHTEQFGLSAGDVQ